MPSGARPAGAVQRPTLRPAAVEDAVFLRRLFGETRAEEMAGTGWDADKVEAFLDSQFALQRAHYLAHYGESGHWIAEVRGRPIGRLWLHDTDDHRLLVDIAVLSQDQGRGHGMVLMRKTLAGARARDLPVRLHVLGWNLGARRLYERLGFVVTGAPDGERLAMEWRPTGA